ncbi:MAG TPA: DUF2256 domain-containing protein [Porticoccaceae bacterium]|nr:DUF2256 domain-containing protein [Porticoccaceae bacterium]
MVLQVISVLKKGDLPQKICVHCQRLFAWRKKWRKDWTEVRYCSQRCRSQAKKRFPNRSEHSEQ